MTTNGQRGANFERRVRKELEAAGYVVIRSAASKSCVDLVALRNHWCLTHGAVPKKHPTPLLVQVKMDNCNHFGPAAWNNLYILALTAGGVPVLAGSEPSGRGVKPIYYRLDGAATPRSRCRPWTRFELKAVES